MTNNPTDPAPPDEAMEMVRTSDHLAGMTAIQTALDQGATTNREHLAWHTDTPWRLEIFLTFCSGWMAIQLWFFPNQFPLGNIAVSLSDALRGQEPSWAFFCTLAALLKLCGLACRRWTTWNGISAGLMIAGLFMSVVIWTIIGLTWSWNYPHSMAPLLLIGGSLGAAWQLTKWKPPRNRPL
jgi:hypothetical protein